ncbi:hypothetical protein CEUSTIGMA_g5174.t1 [Chlamydomonas eustigma]|uniref:PPM-type phosphatase domain-containing protein n=1 Tax=Chlamydomonas eustigma TaxID=1157962 RepID=A0A250X3U4_9CHLO|nr:hypothetical protein CEUSTIGMA_g5174.t1 [Chlamydomonas eustigma]|eukprot:GAX77731.1 hypothetical protein CEUSTIGMA_g5174.t1 [Chlamydomonas eustigma]
MHLLTLNPDWDGEYLIFEIAKMMLPVLMEGDKKDDERNVLIPSQSDTLTPQPPTLRDGQETTNSATCNPNRDSKAQLKLADLQNIFNNNLGPPFEFSSSLDQMLPKSTVVASDASIAATKDVNSTSQVKKHSSGHTDVRTSEGVPNRRKDYSPTRSYAQERSSYRSRSRSRDKGRERQVYNYHDQHNGKHGHNSNHKMLTERSQDREGTKHGSRLDVSGEKRERGALRHSSESVGGGWGCEEVLEPSSTSSQIQQTLAHETQVPAKSLPEKPESVPVHQHKIGDVSGMSSCRLDKGSAVTLIGKKRIMLSFEEELQEGGEVPASSEQTDSSNFKVERHKVTRPAISNSSLGSRPNLSSSWSLGRLEGSALDPLAGLLKHQGNASSSTVVRAKAPLSSLDLGLALGFMTDSRSNPSQELNFSRTSALSEDYIGTKKSLSMNTVGSYYSKKEVISTIEDCGLPPLNSCADGGQQAVVYGVATARNQRPYMEDRHSLVHCLRMLRPDGQPVVVGHPGEVGHSWAGVFDGHNGSRAADIAAARLHMVFASDPSLRPHLGTTTRPLTASSDAEEAAVSGSLRRAFLQIDDDILKQSRVDGSRDGSTALVVAKLGDAVYTAHTGDSRAVLCRNGVAHRLTEDHKPNLPTERSRVLAAGGRVEFQRCWRVVVEPRDGRPGSGLAVSRSLGDLDFKEPKRFVESDPEIHKLMLGETDSYIILASDGLWDVLTDEEAVECANDVLKVSKENAKICINTLAKAQALASAAADKLLQKSVGKGTVDNVTVVVMLLNWQ